MKRMKKNKIRCQPQQSESSHCMSIANGHIYNRCITVAMATPKTERNNSTCAQYQWYDTQRCKTQRTPPRPRNYFLVEELLRDLRARVWAGVMNLVPIMWSV